MTSSRTNPAYRRYVRRMLPLSLAYVGAIGLATRVIPDHAAADARTLGFAILPGLAVMGWIWAMARLLVELDDEYLRMLEVRKFLVATGFTLALCSVWGLLELFAPSIPKLPLFFVFPLWAVGLFVGMLFNRLTMGPSGRA
ncbi:hypothetical protein [Novosphingobium sp. ZW T3_23]|uniref:hypothetical protein n=1 Tax=Novosphingobium sp. ZW T3_23 TaxID=3378084 RepID=UPI003852377B